MQRRAASAIAEQSPCVSFWSLVILFSFDVLAVEVGSLTIGVFLLPQIHIKAPL
jgi:hypothetical protein